MKFYFIRLALVLNFFFVFSCEQKSSSATTISWDTFGVPHIKASSKENLFFAQGWSLMHNHANKLLELYAVSRGKGSEYWGEDYLKNDLLVNTLGFSELADQWEKDQALELKTIYKNFVKGINAYAQNNPQKINEKNKVVLPVTTKDVNMHGMYVVFTRFIGGKDLGRVQRWPDMGSNAYAIGPKRSASGNAMLVQNPHLPWSNEFLFTEYHLNLNGKNMYGANLLGMPGIAIGFNENLGWSHTDNTIDNADTYELDLKNGGYLLDGQKKEFEVLNKTILVKQKDGSLKKKDLSVLKTVHGPVVKKTDDKVLVLRLVGLDRPNMFLQWWKMINSSNFNEFESALKMAQIPFWNVMYADKFGEIFYLFNGLVPKRKQKAWKYWSRIIPGGKSEDIWTEVHSYEDLPKLKNPDQGWLQNANDPPWTSTIPTIINPNNYPDYMAPKLMHFRPQRATRMILEDSSITFDELVSYKLSTRLEFADRILDDLFIAIESFGSKKAKEGMLVLKNWDREANIDSKGMLLFFTWAQKFDVEKNSNYSIDWDPEKPHITPDGIADPKRAVKLFEQSVNEIKNKFGKLNVPWGDYYRINYNGKDLPANGSQGDLGIFRVAWPGRFENKNMYVGGGDSWVGVIEFGEKIKAKVLLSYGNSTEKDSPHNGDQLEYFSQKKLREAWFYEEDVISNTKKVEIKVGNTFMLDKP